MPRVTLLAVGTGLLLTGLTYWVIRSNQPPPPVRYVTVPVRRSTVTLTYAATGEVEPTSTQSYTLPDASASVTSLAVSVGQQVKPGQLLAQLADPSLQSQLTTAQAALQKAEAVLAAAVSPTTGAAADAAVQQAEDNVTVAQDTLHSDQALLASLTLRAVSTGVVQILVTVGQSVSAGQALATQNGVTYSSPAAGTVAAIDVSSGATVSSSAVLMQISDPALTVKVAQDQSQLAASQAALDNALVNNSPSALSSAADQDQALVQADEANVKALTQAVDALTITAPYAGVVTVAQADPPGLAQPVVAIASDTRAVTIPVPETSITDLHVGQTVSATLPAYPGHPLTGQLSSIDPVATYTNGVASFSVTATLNGWPGSSYYGVSANVTIVLQRVHGQLTIPLEALRTRAGHTVVLVPSGQGTKAVPVQVILETPTKVAVRAAGLRVGEPVVIAEPASTSGKLSLKARGRAVHRAGARKRGARGGGKA